MKTLSYFYFQKLQKQKLNKCSSAVLVIAAWSSRGIFVMASSTYNSKTWKTNRQQKKTKKKRNPNTTEAN